MIQAHTTPERRRAPYVVALPAQIAALSVPVRQSIVDAVAASGPCSIAMLATQLGRPASGLYHHVRALARAGLLVSLDSPRRSAGRPASWYDVPGRPMRIRYAPGVAATRRPMTRVVGAMTRLAARQFADGYRPGIRVSGPARELWASRAEAWLTPTQLRHANELLVELFQLFTQSGRPARGRTQIRSLMFVLAPSGEKT